jgi:hypothetical protein
VQNVRDQLDQFSIAIRYENLCTASASGYRLINRACRIHAQSIASNQATPEACSRDGLASGTFVL